MFVRICIRLAAAAVLCASVAAPVAANASATPLTLINGWKKFSSSSAKPAITAIKGVAYLQGAIKTKQSNNEPFVLPAAFRPAAHIYAKVDLCNAHNGRLDISTDGTVLIDVEDNDFAQAQCFTSLDGVSFALSTDGYAVAKLKNGWGNTAYGTAAPATNSAAGMVYLQGAMSTSGTNTTAFTLPAKDRPSATVYVPADMYDATNGRLVIATNGTVSVESETDNNFAFGFTSLDGISFAINDSGFTPITLINGWTSYGTRNPAVRLNGKLVQLQGAIATTGTNPIAFVMPANMRPSKAVYVPVDLCDATNGRLIFDTTGNVYVESEGDFSDAQCFTSLEGVSFLR